MKRYADAEWQRSMQITVDYNGMMSGFIGERGIHENDIADMSDCAAKAVIAMRENRADMKWRELPYQDKSIVERIEAAAQRIRDRFESFVVLGIGGSALGPMAVHNALCPMRYNELSAEKRGGPRFYVEDNIDPERFKSLLDVIDPRKTMFNVITKSGSTSETMAQLQIITGILKNTLGESFSGNIIATTDKEKGNLVKIARELGIEMFTVPDGVGGRFSELCSVGLLPAAVCGVDIRELLAGAAYMDDLCQNDDYMSNPAYALGLTHRIAMSKGINISVCMPYADSLRLFADWYAQLWAESLGKQMDRDGHEIYAGQTPVKSLGVTDQHSQVQLYIEGPFDKAIMFIGVKRFRETINIPDCYPHIPDVSFLGGHTLNELIKAEQFATEYALTKSGRMNALITLPEVNAFTIGQLIYMLEVQTAYAGELLNIDAFNQPGVEEGKNATYALLNKPGYNSKREELENARKKNSKYIIGG